MFILDINGVSSSSLKMKICTLLAVVVSIVVIISVAVLFSGQDSSSSFAVDSESQSDLQISWLQPDQFHTGEMVLIRRDYSTTPVTKYFCYYFEVLDGSGDVEFDVWAGSQNYDEQTKAFHVEEGDTYCLKLVFDYICEYSDSRVPGYSSNSIKVNINSPSASSSISRSYQGWEALEHFQIFRISLEAYALK